MYPLYTANGCQNTWLAHTHTRGCQRLKRCRGVSIASRHCAGSAVRAAALSHVLQRFCGVSILHWRVLAAGGGAQAGAGSSRGGVTGSGGGGVSLPPNGSRRKAPPITIQRAIGHVFAVGVSRLGWPLHSAGQRCQGVGGVGPPRSSRRSKSRPTLSDRGRCAGSWCIPASPELYLMLPWWPL